MAEAALMRGSTGVVRIGSALRDAEAAVRLADLDPGRAAPVAAAAVASARRERDRAAEAIAQRAWGHSLLHCGEMDSAIRHLQRAVRCAELAGSPPLAGEAQVKLAHAMIQRGHPRSALVAVDAALGSLEGVARARALAQRAIILHLSGRLDEAEAGFNAALPALRHADDTLGIQRMLINRGFLHADRHAFPLAEADLVEAERLARQLGRQLTIGIIAANLGFFATLRGDVPAALAHFDRAERITAAHGAQLGTIHQDRGELLLSVGLVSEARAAATKAVLAYQREQRGLKVPEVRLLLAQAALLDGDHSSALDYAVAARRDFSRQHRAEWVELARLVALRATLASPGRVPTRLREVETMVDVLSRAGWPAAALEARLVAAQVAGLSGREGAGARRREHLLVAGRLAGRRGPAAMRARGWYAQALLRLDVRQPRAAAAAARRGLRILDEHNASMAATDLRAHAAIHRAELVELGLRVALDGGRPAHVFEWAERGRASHLLHRPVRPPADQAQATLLSQLRAVAGEIDKARDAGRGTARLANRQVQLERLIRDQSRLRRGELGGPLASPVRPAELSHALRDWALVEFVQLDGVLHGLSLADGRLRLRPVGAASVVTGLVERLPFALHRLAARSAPAESRAAALALLRAAAARLDAVLLGPFAAEVGDKPLVVAPTGSMHGVPWSTLPSCSGRPLVVAPSATLWHASSTSTGDGAVGVAVAAGPRLPGAREEAQAVAAVHGTTALLDGAATADKVLAALGSAGLVHLAAHGRLSADNPLFSELLLADGPLVVYDLEQLPHVPHTVVLAACDSGRSVVRTGDELLGLSAAFIARGAAQLVASVVPIPDAQTAPLMVAFHQRLARGESPAVALAAAQRQITGGDTGGDTAALAAAAGFVCLGAGMLTGVGRAAPAGAAAG
jgi:tetratricopeptide (TPR) repeat protein